MKKDIVLPNYNHCILNTITSVLNYYGVNSNHNSLPNLDSILNKTNPKNIIFLILDGLGECLLNNISKDGYFKNNQIDCVSSVYPSTTTAALTSYYSGSSPYETGWIAWAQYFKEYGRALDMFSHNDSYLKMPLKSPIQNIFESEMNYETVFDKIEKSNLNIKTFQIAPEYSDRKCMRRVIANNIDEIIMNIKDISEIPDKKFIMAYCDNPDSLLHKYGTDSDEVKKYILNVEKTIAQLRNELLDDTLIIITADHGHKNIEKSYSIIDYPELWECFLMPPTFESRALNFYIKPNMKNIFEKRFNKIFKNEFWLVSKDEFFKKNFLGFGEKHNKIDDFIGDYIAMSISSSMIRLETFLAEGKPIKKSTHCGLSEEEMKVPVIVLKR